MRRESQPEIMIVADDQMVGRSAADMIVEQLRASLQTQDVFTFALAGGSTPRGLYALLANQPFAKSEIPWGRVHFFWGDERHVAPDHSDSNYQMAQATLLSQIDLPPANIHRVQGEDPDAPGTAAMYEQELLRFFKPRAGQLPRFDLILLGLGTDGHTASLFAATAALQHSKRLVVANWVPKLHAYRITMTVPLINNARLVIFLVSGGEKAEILHRVLQGGRQTDPLPAQLIRPTSGRLLWIVDRDAAKYLDLPTQQADICAAKPPASPPADATGEK